MRKEFAPHYFQFPFSIALSDRRPAQLCRSPRATTPISLKFISIGTHSKAPDEHQERACLLSAGQMNLIMH